MGELQSTTRAALLRVGTSTLTGLLNRRGLRSMFMQDVYAIRPDVPRMVGIAFTMRFIPAREDKDGPGAPRRMNIQSEAMETCPAGHVLVVDSRGDARAASAGDLYVGRLKARGCAGIVTDGGLRDTEGIFKTGLPAYHRRAASPPSPIAHHPCDLNLPIGCGGVAVYPGDIIVGDCDGVVVIPPDIVDALAEEALETTLYEEFAEEEVARGRALPGLFPVPGEEAKRDFAAWKKARAGEPRS
jgi:regulator of RNase E activity RraA